MLKGSKRVVAPAVLKGSRRAVAPAVLKGSRRVVAPAELKGSKKGSRTCGAKRIVCLFRYSFFSLLLTRAWYIRSLKPPSDVNLSLIASISLYIR